MTTDAKPTPGPWTVNQAEGTAFADIRAGVQSIAAVYHHVGSSTLMDQHGQGEANARLMAAAPDLLKALERLLGIGFTAEAQRMAKDAIAKATGRTA